MRILWVSDILDANNTCLSGLGVATGHHAGYLRIRQTGGLDSCGDPLKHAVAASVVRNLVSNGATNSSDNLHVTCS